MVKKHVQMNIVCEYLLCHLNGSWLFLNGIVFSDLISIFKFIILVFQYEYKSSINAHEFFNELIFSFFSKVNWKNDDFTDTLKLHSIFWKSENIGHIATIGLKWLQK